MLNIVIALALALIGALILLIAKWENQTLFMFGIFAEAITILPGIVFLILNV